MRQETRALEAEKLAEVVLSSTNSNQISSVLKDFSDDRLYDIATSILPTGYTLIHLLAQREKLQALRSVLLRGVGCKARNSDGVTPLHCALLQNRLEAARIMIDQGGASVTEVVHRRKERTLLHLMVTCNRPKALSLLLEYQVDSNVRDYQGRTPLHLAAIYNNCPITAILLRHEQCDVNAFDKSGLSALMQAVVNDNTPVARLLAECSRVDVVLRDKAQDMSALHMAVTRGQLDTARTLLRRNSANLHCKERYMGRQPIHLACALAISASGTVTSNCFLENASLAESPRPSDAASRFRESDEEKGGFPSTELERALRNRALTAPQLLEFLQEQEEERLGIRAATNRATNIVISLPDNLASDDEWRTSSSLSMEHHPNQHVHDVKNVSICEPPCSPSATTLSVSVQSKTDVLNGNDPGQASGRKTSSSTVPQDGAGAAKASRKSVSLSQSTPRVVQDNANGRWVSPTGLRYKRSVNDACPNPRFRARHSISGDRPSRPQSSSTCRGPLQQRQSKASLTNVSHVAMATIHKKSTGVRPSTVIRPSTAPATQDRADLPSVPSSPSSHVKEATSSYPSASKRPATTSSPNGHVPRVSKQVDLTTFQTTPAITPATLGSVRLRMVELLLEYGADSNLMTSFRRAPIHIAAMSGAADVLALLLPLVPNINVLSHNKQTALHLAVEKGHKAVVEALLRAGANTRVRDLAGVTPLHEAARLGLAPIASLLLLHGASHKATDDRQMTPLHYACRHGHQSVVDILLNAGASTTHKDVAGNMPLDYVVTDRPRVKASVQ